MSLEQQIGALVKASENLTGAVNGKIGEIDHKVEQSIEELNNAFPIKYKEYSSRSHYVNGDTGSDSNNGLSWATALKTVSKAINLGDGAVDHQIYVSFGKHVIENLLYCSADNVTIVGMSGAHYPEGNWSEATSSILHIDKTKEIRAGIFTKLFGGVFVDKVVITMEGQPENTHTDNCIFRGRGNVSLRIPLIVFDSPNRGIMKVMNDYNPFCSLGAELPQFEGEAGALIKGDNSTCIVNIDRMIDRTSGIKSKIGSVVVLS